MHYPVSTYTLPIIVLISGLLAHEPALAQGADELIEEIVVTARGREESLIEVPISETVFDSQAIKDARIDRVDDFIALTPNVTISNAQDSGTNFITIRGLSQTRNGEPPVAVVVDGVLQTSPRSFDQGLFDVESIEVLRGPQGALYGRNATGGALLINTVGPTEEFEGYVQGTYGEADEFGIEGSFSGPISDQVGFRLSASYNDRDGYFDNVTRNEDAGFYEEFLVRGHLHADLTERFSADLRVSLVRTEGDALNFTFQGVSTDAVTGVVDGFPGISDADVVQRNFAANNAGFDERDLNQFSLRLHYDFDWGTFTSVTAYDDLDQETGGDQFPYSANSTFNPGISFFDGTQTQFIDVEAFSQEIRLSSVDDQALRWTVGAYYLQTDRFIASTTGNDLELGLLPVGRTPLLGNAINPTTSFLADDNDNTAFAVFFNIAYDISDQLELSVAGRYDEDERQQTVSPLNGFFDGTGALLGPAGSPGAVNEETFSRFQPKVSLSYRFNEDASVYGSWGQGFRSGQFNQNGVAAAAAAAGLVGISDVYDQEDSETWEVGFKTQFLDNRVRLSGALYQTDIENAPYFVFIGGVGAQVLVGIDEIEVFGGEVEVAALLGGGFEAYAGVGVTSTDIEEYAVNPAAEGNDAPYVPESTFNVGVQYRTELSSQIGLFFRADYELRGEQFWDPENTTERSSLSLLNVRGGIESNDGVWSLVASGDNLTDEVYNSEWVLGGFAHAGLPRVWRVDLRYNF